MGITRNRPKQVRHGVRSLIGRERPSRRKSRPVAMEAGHLISTMHLDNLTRRLCHATGLARGPRKARTIKCTGVKGEGTLSNLGQWRTNDANAGAKPGSRPTRGRQWSEVMDLVTVRLGRMGGIPRAWAAQAGSSPARSTWKGMPRVTLSK
jgi:hypothetical protein